MPFALLDILHKKVLLNIEGNFSISDGFFNSNNIFLFLKYYTIPFFILLIVTLTVILIVNRYTYEQLIYPRRVLKLRIDAFLIEVLYSGYSMNETKEKIKSFKNSDKVPFEKNWCREMILNKIIEIKRNLHGFDNNQVLLIYKYFGFESYSKKLIQSRKWYKKTMGIYHYQMLDYKIKKGTIKRYIYSKNRFLKSNALIGLISLLDEKFEFLNNYTEVISRADEMKILEVIYQKKIELPKSINNWLTNENTSVVLLAIKILIQYRKPLELNQIELLLSNKKKKIRKEVLLAIRELVIVESNTILLKHYEKETDKRNKISTLKTLGVIGNKETAEFAISLLHETDIDLKFEIIKCIYKIQSSYFDDCIDLSATENETIKNILLHIKSPYLN
ncbi:MAG: hypothetical protein V4548_09160 [Bacteroidota bacterium]